MDDHCESQALGRIPLDTGQSVNFNDTYFWYSELSSIILNAGKLEWWEIEEVFVPHSTSQMKRSLVANRTRRSWFAFVVDKCSEFERYQSRGTFFTTFHFKLALLSTHSLYENEATKSSIDWPRNSAWEAIFIKLIKLHLKVKLLKIQWQTRLLISVHGK